MYTIKLINFHFHIIILTFISYSSHTRISLVHLGVQALHWTGSQNASPPKPHHGRLDA
jgi:hypothetical protein